MRRLLISAASTVVLAAFPLQAKEVFIPIVGSVGAFRTDVRIVNPTTAQIVVNAQLLPTCGVGPDGATSCPALGATVPITIPARQMKVLDDMVAATMNSTGLAGLRLTTASADFTSTARIFAQTSSGTLGQFVTANQASEGLKKGILQQLKSNAAFRTNVGMLNPNNSVTNVTMFVHAGAEVIATKAFTLQAFAVLQPVNVTALFPIGGNPLQNLSDIWISFDASQNILAYGSVVDNATTDPTYVAAVADSGTDVQATGPQTRTFEVIATDFTYTISPGGRIVANAGDTVVLKLTSTQGTHGFQMSPFVTNATLPQGSTIEKRFVVPIAGEFTFFCTIFCGSGHGEMSGTMKVNAANGSRVEIAPAAAAPAGAEIHHEHRH